MVFKRWLWFYDLVSIFCVGVLCFDLARRPKANHVRCVIGTTVVADVWTDSPVELQRRPDEWFVEESQRLLAEKKARVRCVDPRHE